MDFYWHSHRYLKLSCLLSGFIVVASCVMTFEARDSAAKVVPARFKVGSRSRSSGGTGSRRTTSKQIFRKNSFKSLKPLPNQFHSDTHDEIKSLVEEWNLHFISTFIRISHAQKAYQCHVLLSWLHLNSDTLTQIIFRAWLTLICDCPRKLDKP